MSRDERERWDARYQTGARWSVDHLPFPWLVEHAPPSQNSLALDIACGLGHNALWLARQGYRVLGVDISLVALRRGLKAVRFQGLNGRVLFAQVDMDHFRPPQASFDLIGVIRFLNRDIFPAIVYALKPGGLLIYATLNWRYAEFSPETPSTYLLSPGELEQAFPTLEITEIRERGDMSCLVARKPPG